MEKFYVGMYFFAGCARMETKKKYNETIEKGVAFRKISTFCALFYKKFIFFN